MLKVKQSAVSALLAAGVFMAPGAAFAFHDDPNYRAALSGNTMPCRDGTAVGAKLVAVWDAIDAAEYLSKRNAEGDEHNLLNKLLAANAKTLQDKYGDAIDKLMNIDDTATALATAVKPKLVGAEAISTAVGAAISCLTR